MTAGRGFGRQLVARARTVLGEEWANLPPGAADAVEAALLDAAELTIRKLDGADVDADLAYCRSTIQDWRFVGDSRARAAMEAAAIEAIEFVGKVLLGVVAASL